MNSVCVLYVLRLMYEACAQIMCKSAGCINSPEQLITCMAVVLVLIVGVCHCFTIAGAIILSGNDKNRVFCTSIQVKTLKN